MKNNNKNNWISALFSLIFIGFPAIILFYFFLPSWSKSGIIINYGFVWLIALSFILYVISFNVFLIYINFISLESLNFNIPISMSLMSILISNPLPFWAISLIVIFCILFGFPMNIITNKYKEHKIYKNKKLKNI